MTKEDYLIHLKFHNKEELKKTWVALGAIKVDNNTKVYTKDTLVKVNTISGQLAGALVYVKSTYAVGEDKPPINWETATYVAIDNMLYVEQGITSSCFKVIALSPEFPSGEEENPSDFIPFKGVEIASEVEMDDDELIVLMTECGVPFLRFDELEYDKPTIYKYMIKPALDVHYSLHPIIVDESLGNYSAGASFKVPFPKDVHGAIVYYVLGQGGNGASFGSGAFSLYREQMMYGTSGTSGSGFGTGVSYRKPVPGFVGLQAGDAALQGMQAAQGYANYFRREHYKKVKENGKYYATGYSTLGGALQAKWLKHSYDWNDIEFEYLPDVRNLCKAYIMRNLGMLRAMLKSDTAGSIDFSLYNSRADTLEQKVMEKWEKQPTMLSHSIMRGGL